MADEKDLESPDDIEPSKTPTPEEGSADAETPSSDADAEANGVEADATPEGKDAPPEEDAVPADDAAPAAKEGATPSVDDILAEAGAADDASSSGDDFKVVNKDDVGEDDAEAAMLAMLEEVPEDGAGATPDDIDFGSANVSQAEFQQLSEPAGRPEVQNIDMLMDINLPVSIELGRTRMSISEILALGPGSVVELNKLAGEPVDLLVNYKTVARGEVVVIDENFGVRITNLISPEERLKALGEEQ